MTVPKILEIPSKLYPIVTQFNEYRYFLLEGGRGGGKSQAVGRFILYLAEKYKLRIVCGRETQNSINESVYSLLADLIREFQLNFEIMSSKIIHKKTGSTINFRGFREQGRFNIQGMEGIDVLWIDESQAITKQTLDVLIPTIRKDKSRIFFSMNRHVENDPVFVKFHGRDDCLHVHINYHENPYCTAVLKKEASECQKISEKDYNHIWLGQPLDQSEDAVYSRPELINSKGMLYPLRDGYGLRLAGFDIARYGDDKCAAVIIQQQGALHWRVHHVEQWDKRDLNYTTGRILSITNEQQVNQSIIDEDGLGSGPFDTLVKGRGLKNFKGFRNPNIGYKDNKDYANPRTVNAYVLQGLVSRGHIQIEDDDLVNELTTIKYTFDHSQRRVLVSKDEMRKKGVKSPNLADGLIMAVSMIKDIKNMQQNRYGNIQPAYTVEGNILDTAGIR